MYPGASGRLCPGPLHMFGREGVIAMRALIDRALTWVFIALGMGVVILAGIQALGLAE